MARTTRYRESIGSRAFDAANVFFMCSLIIVMLYPLLHVIAISLSNPSMVATGRVTFYPRQLHLSGYEVIFRDGEILRTYRNTILYAFGGTVITLLSTSMIAYPLSIRDFMLRRFLTVYLAITMFFSGGLIPTYLLIRSLGMMNTYLVMVLPTAIAAFSVIVFRTFFQGLPQDLRESAFMDGANDFLILFIIVLPLSKALLATFALFSIVGHWNSWFPALLYLTDRNRWPVQLILRRLVVQLEQAADPASMYMVAAGHVHPKNIRMAVIVVVMVPILCVYPFLQKYFAKGVLIGSIKG